MTTDLTPLDDDLFDDATAAPLYGLHSDLLSPSPFKSIKGRYRFPPPPGFAPSGRGWRRTTNLVKAFSDQYALQQWLERMTLLGLLANDGLIFDELAAINLDAFTDSERRTILAKAAELARTAAGADTGARKGTARHAVLEQFIMAGEVIGHRRMQVQFAEMIEVMDRKGFEFIPDSQERFIFHPIGGGAVGRRDARFLCRGTGQVGTIDLKTQEKFWTYQEHSGQQWIYDTAPWVWEGPLDDSGRWMPQDAGTYVGREGGVCPGKPAALLIHMPSKGGRVELVELDLEYGRQVAEQAARNVELRSVGTRAGGICPA